MFDMKEIGKTICELRKANNYSQAELGRLLKVTDSLISKWENGSSEISVPDLDALSKLFNMSIPEIMVFQEKKNEEKKKQEEEQRRIQKEKNENLRRKLSSYEGFHCEVWDYKKGYSNETAKIKQEYDGKKLKLYQPEDPDIVLFDSCLHLHIRSDFSAKCYFLHKGEWSPCSLYKDEENSWSILFDFNDPIERIKFSFDEQGIEDYVFEVEYVYSDREAWLEKKRNEKRQEMLSRMNIKILGDIRNGYQPINIVFRPADDTFAYAVLDLYYYRKIETWIDEYNYRKEEGYDLLKSYRIPDGELIWTSMDLYMLGGFFFSIKQFDKDNHLIIESEKIPLAR